LPFHLASERKLEQFLTALAKENVATSTQNQAFNAILFFYKQVLGGKLKGVDALRARRPARCGARQGGRRRWSCCGWFRVGRIWR
jgi:hypothetical protein